MKTEVSKNLCIGCALCPSLSPDIYTMERDGKAGVIKKGELNRNEGIEASEAADSCPTNAISVMG